MSEIWDLLDEKGREIGRTMQKGEPIPEGLYHKGADVWIVNAKHQILIQKRSPKKRLSPNVWAMTGGSVIIGETSLQTIARETFEELGIRLNLQNVHFMKNYCVDEVWLDEYRIRQEVDLNDILMQEDEVCDVKWATYAEIEELLETGQFLKNRWEFVRELVRDFWKK